MYGNHQQMNQQQQQQQQQPPPTSRVVQVRNVKEIFTPEGSTQTITPAAPSQSKPKIINNPTSNTTTNTATIKKRDQQLNQQQQKQPVNNIISSSRNNSATSSSTPTSTTNRQRSSKNNSSTQQQQIYNNNYESHHSQYSHYRHHHHHHNPYHQHNHHPTYASNSGLGNSNLVRSPSRAKVGGGVRGTNNSANVYEMVSMCSTHSDKTNRASIYSVASSTVQRHKQIITNTNQTSGIISPSMNNNTKQPPHMIPNGNNGKHDRSRVAAMYKSIYELDMPPNNMHSPNSNSNNSATLKRSMMTTNLNLKEMQQAFY